MAESLFIMANVEISESALRRWLKSAPLPVAAFDDWPNWSGGDTPERGDAPAQTDISVADALISYCTHSLGTGDGYLHCNYDEASSELRFAARFQYGDEAWARSEAIFLCALLRGLAAVYLAKKPCSLYLFDSGAERLRIDISKKSSHVLLSEKDMPTLPAWFAEWVSQDLDNSESLVNALYLPLARALKKRVSLGALSASPQNPYYYDSQFGTDGQCVFSRWPTVQVVEGAKPETFRRLTPAGNLDSAFYTDGHQLWYSNPMLEMQKGESAGGMVLVQQVEAGASMQGWRPFGADGEPVVRCGNTVWMPADVEFDGWEERMKQSANSALNRLITPMRAPRHAIEKALGIIMAQGGIPIWKKTYNYAYLRPTTVDGKSFSWIEDYSFKDKNSAYTLTQQGLIRVEQ